MRWSPGIKQTKCCTISTDGCCKCNEIEMALKVYHNMKALSIKPSNVTTAFSSRSMESKRIVKACQSWTRWSLNLTPGLIVYTCLCRLHQGPVVEDAQQILRDMKVRESKETLSPTQPCLTGVLGFRDSTWSSTFEWSREYCVTLKELVGLSQDWVEQIASGHLQALCQVDQFLI